MADGKVKIDTSLDTSGVDKGINDLKKKLDTAGKNINESAKSAKGLEKSLGGISKTALKTAAGITGVTVALKKTVDALNDCEKAYKQQQKAEIALQTAAKNNPYLNDESVQNLKTFASTLQGISEVSDEVSLKVMSQLAATGRTEEQIMQIMSAAADMSAVTGNSLQNVAIQLSKTYSGLSGELGEANSAVRALTQEELKNGKAVEIIAAQYKGSAEAMADKTVQLSNAWGDFKENIGRGWSNITAPVKQFFLDVLNSINEATTKTNDIKNAATKNAAGTATAADTKILLDDATKRLDDLKNLNAEYIQEAAETVDTLEQLQREWDEKYGGMNPRMRRSMGAPARPTASSGAKGGAYNKSAAAERAQEIKELESEVEKLTKQYNDLSAAEKAEADAAAKNATAAEKAAALEKQKAQRDADAIAHINANTKALQEQIDAMELRANMTGEEIDAQAMYNAYLDSYIDLVTKSNGLVSEGNTAAKDRLKLLEEWAEKAGIAEKKEQDAAQAKKEYYADLANDIKGYVEQTVDVVKEAGDLMLQNVQNQQALELAALEEKYEKGELSEEEYYDKQKEIQRKAAQEEYKIKMFQWTASLLAATANIAEGISKAIAQGGAAGLVTGALVGAAGAVQIASITASKPLPPSFYTGGIVGGMYGASMGGDNTYIHARNGEMILNAQQQRGLWDSINGIASRAGGGLNIVVNNTQAATITTETRQQNDGLYIDILDKHINKGFSDGTYDAGLNAMNTRQEGVRIL